MYTGILGYISFNLRQQSYYEKIKLSSSKRSVESSCIPDNFKKSFDYKAFFEFDFVRINNFIFKNGFYIFKIKEGSKYQFNKIISISSNEEEVYFLIEMELFEFINELNSYKHVNLIKNSFSILSLTDIFYEPIEPYIINNEIYLCPFYRYNE